jgi:hypothetical protein
MSENQMSDDRRDYEVGRGKLPVQARPPEGVGASASNTAKE